MNTNASGRDPEFWKDLGEMFKENGTVIFSVDGLEDTNWIYRRGTHWDKIMSAIKNYKSTGAEARWEFLVFRHNEHQIEEARKLSKELGIETFFPKKAMGFEEDKDGQFNMNVYSTEGRFEYTIKPATTEGKNWDTKINDRMAGEGHFDKNKNTDLSVGYLKDVKLQLEKSKNSTHILHWTENEVDLTLVDEHEKKLSSCDIQCEALDTHQVFIDYDGVVFPCCYTAAFYRYKNGDLSLPLKNFINNHGKENLSLHHTSLKNIIDGDMFANKWIESFEDRDIKNKRLKVCSVFCGVEA
jgi:hypothetical protein